MEITGSAWFAKFRKSVHSLSAWLERIGLVAVVMMVVAALIDVIGSKAFAWPLPGSTEATGVLQVAAIAGGLAFSKIEGRHIRVDFLIDKLRPRAKTGLEIFISLLGIGLFAVAALMSWKYGLRQLGNSTETLLLGIPLYPFSLWISFCCIVMAIVIITELLGFIDKVRK